MKNVLKNRELNKEETISAAELRDALEIIVKNEQQQLAEQPQFKKIKSSLNLFQDEKGIFRQRGRFGNASLLEFDEKYPILLRNSSYVTRLIIRKSHEEVLHHGVESTLAQLRRKYWIMKGRKTVKDLLRKCSMCLRFHRNAIVPPSSPDLPDFRLKFSAFRATGLDFADHCL